MVEKLDNTYLVVNLTIYTTVLLSHFQYAGEVYEGIHEPIISKELFDRVQTVFNRRWRYSPSEKQRTTKPFLGLLHCAECGGAITGEIQKGHTYYRCTKKNRNRRCRQPFIREEDLNAQISALLKPFLLPTDWADEMLARVNPTSATGVRF